MKRNTIFSAMTAIVLATVLSGCFGLGTSLGMDYGPGYDDLWYDGYGNSIRRVMEVRSRVRGIITQTAFIRYCM